MSRFSLSPRLLVATSLALPFLSGCLVGPDFHRPAPPQTRGYLPNDVLVWTVTNAPGAAEQHLLPGLDIAEDWWTLFQCPPLNALIQRSFRANPNLKAARAALVVARENALAQRGAYIPGVSASLSASRQKTSAAVSPTPNSGNLYYDLYTPQVSVAYTPDVFGLNRRTVESLQAQQAEARFALVAADIALSANVVSAAIQEASLRGQLAATRQIIEDNTRMLQIVRQQFAQGYASRLDVATQESQLALVTASLFPLEKQLAQQRDLLSALAGEWPGEVFPEQFELANLKLPRELPVSFPAAIVTQRPDVRQAEENLRAAAAQVGMAVANRLPNIMLTADVGSMALAAGQMFASGSGIWGLGANVAQPIFQGGTLRHRERAARAACQVATEQYRAAVLTAFQNVADTLVALKQDAAATQAATDARDAAEVTLNLARQQWQAGYAGYLAVLAAEQASYQAAINLVQAQANRYADTAALFLALGGGWWHRADYVSK